MDVLETETDTESETETDTDTETEPDATNNPTTAMLKGDPVAKELQVEEFLEGDFPAKAPSIVNAKELGLATR